MYILIGIALVITIPILALVIKGYSATKPTIRAFSIGPDLKHHEIQISQPYFGPKESAPNAREMLEATAGIVEHMSGYDENLPRITVEDIRSLPPVFTEEK